MQRVLDLCALARSSPVERTAAAVGRGDATCTAREPQPKPSCKYRCEILTLLVTGWRALGEGGLGVSGTVAAFSVQPDACTPPPEDLRLGIDSTPSPESLAGSEGPGGLKVAFLAASTRLGLALDISGRELAEDAALLVAISRRAAAQQLEPANHRCASYGLYVYKVSPWKHYRSRDQNGRR